MHSYVFRTLRKLALATAVAAFLASAAIPSHSQDDPPSQAGRLSSLSGTVSVQPLGSDNWGQGTPNLPLGPGDRIFTDSDGRAEIQVGQTFLRVGPNSDVSFVDASPEGISFGVAQGSVHIHTLGLWPGQAMNVNTPNGSASLRQPGELRVDVLPDEDAAIFTNLGNDAFVFGAGGFRQDLSNGQVLELLGSNPVTPQWLEPADPDNLDAWSHARDHQIEHAVSYRYVSPEIPGADELDANGIWLPGTSYGAIWFPNNLPAGWAPYHYGRWINHDPWGWVWVEDESWGYAPFHYGRWVTVAGRWGWVPGPPAAHPVWSPALVVFAGGIHAGGASVSAWFPLGPGEAYRPWYHTSPHYIDQVNISNMAETPQVHVQTSYVNIVNVPNITYVNHSSGVSVMRSDDFAAGRRAHEAAITVDLHLFDHVQPLAAPEARPQPQAVVFAPPARPVPVRVERPVVINIQGQMVAARPGAAPVAPPVKAAPPIRPVAGHTFTAPPPGATPPPARVPPPTSVKPVPAPVVPIVTRPAPPSRPAPVANPEPTPVAPVVPRPVPPSRPAPVPSLEPAPKPAPVAPQPVAKPAPPAASSHPTPLAPTSPKSAPPAPAVPVKPAPTPAVPATTKPVPSPSAKPVQQAPAAPPVKPAATKPAPPPAGQPGAKPKDKDKDKNKKDEPAK